MKRGIKLGVNIDHIATLRQARGGSEPNVLNGAIEAESAGADCITVHLREDRRHIQDADVSAIKKNVKVLNLEMANNSEILGIALKIKPAQATLVPERRAELTTEGGLNAVKFFKQLSPSVKKLQAAGIIVSLFIEPDIEQVKASADLGASHIEIHTGAYANAGKNYKSELKKIFASAEYAEKSGLIVNAGHGLNYSNVQPLFAFNNWNEFNIGHSIISLAVFSGLQIAVKKMKFLLNGYRQNKK